MSKISSDMEKNIKNYSKQIRTLSDYVETVRTTYSMYIGFNNERGCLHLIKEILGNAMDELNRSSRGLSPCTEISIEFTEGPCITKVSDNGRGIPFEKALDILTNLHTSSNYDKSNGDFTTGLNGVGAKITNALSEFFIMESHILGDSRRIEFIEGKPTTKEMVSIKSDKYQGTDITFAPSRQIMTGIDKVKVIDVLNLVKDMTMLTPIGSVINFKATYPNGEVYTERIVNEDGIVTDLINKTTNPLIKPIIISDGNNNMKADIAFTYDSNDLVPEQITSFANGNKTVAGGTHVDALLDSIGKYFRNYMNKIFLNGARTKIVINNNDIRTGLKGIISVSLLRPAYGGQNKESLTSDEITPYVSELVTNTLNNWSKENPSDLQKLCKYFKEIAEIRTKSEEGKVKLKDKYTKSSVTGLPAKYIKPLGKEGLELIICEGDSAAGGIQNNRDNQRQGIFPIRGKLPSAFTTPREKFLANAEVAAIITLIGGGYGRNFNIDDVKWDKIIISTDADIDGSHIRALLLRFFIMYMPQLIQAGKVYSAEPPLYGVKKGKKTTYYKDKIEYIKYTQSEFSKNNKICNLKGKQLSNNQLLKLMVDNMYYTYEVGIIRDRYAIDPYLLECILINRNKTENELARLIKKNYRFVNDIKKSGDTIIIRGLVDSKYQNIFLNQKLLDDSKKIIDYLDSNLDHYFLLNGEVVSLYKLMTTFENTSFGNITRFKGLGEMDPMQLFESTINPGVDSQRTLTRYNIEDLKKELETITYLENNRAEIIKDMKVSRSDVLG